MNFRLNFQQRHRKRELERDKPELVVSKLVFKTFENYFVVNDFNCPL